MKYNLRFFGFCVFGVVLGALLSEIAIESAAVKSARFTVGQTYMVVWECLPIPNGQPCYVEELTVKAVYDDGWIDVIDEGEVRATGKTSLYTANPARMLAFSVKAASRQAVIEHGPVYRMPVIVAR